MAGCNALSPKMGDPKYSVMFEGVFFEHRAGEHSYYLQFASNFLRNVQKWVFLII